MICKYCCKEFNDLSANRVCSKCSNKVRICENRDEGCTFQNLSNKCLKHELYYCDYNYECDFSDCEEEICSGGLIRHYYLEHDVEYFLEGLRIEIQQRPHLQVLTLAADIGYILCEYYFDNDKFQIYLYSPLSNEQLINYECEISIKHPYPNEEWEEFFPACQLFGKEDWFFQIDRFNLPFWRNSFTIFISITRK